MKSNFMKLEIQYTLVSRGAPKKKRGAQINQAEECIHTHWLQVVRLIRMIISKATYSDQTNESSV